MLPSNLLVARRRRDSITPVYAELDEDTTQFAEQLIETYQKHIGQKKSAVTHVLSEMETGREYRFVRGLATILDRRSQLRTESTVNPLDARRRVFKEAAIEGIPTSGEERSAILSAVSEELKTDSDSLEASLYADLEDEMLLVGLDPIDSISLLKQYNLSLVQTLLFNATELSFTAVDHWQQIFRRIKALGLIYTITRGNRDYSVKVDGPLSVFKLERRYGVSLAKLLPSVTGSSFWRLTAKVVEAKGSTRLLNFEITSIHHGRYLKETASSEAEAFDSRVEENFATRFKALASGWTLTREPGPLQVGAQVMLPDFMFTKNGVSTYLEIVGFWTPEYLNEKIRKLEAVRDVDMIVAVDKRLLCHRFVKLREHMQLLYFKGRIPLIPILNHLKEKELALVQREVKSISDTELHLAIPVAEPEDVSPMLGLSVESVKAVMEQLHAEGYRRYGDTFLNEEFLRMVEDDLHEKLSREGLSFAEASRIVESHGGKKPSLILEALGYDVQWNSINPEQAKVFRRTKEEQSS